MGGTGIPLWSNAKRTFWNGVTRMYNRHNGITPPSADEIARRARAHYLIGEAGFPNYGDEIIAREWVKYLAQVDPEVPVIFDCLCAGPAAAILHGLHPKLTVVDTVAQLCMTDRERLWHALPEADRASTAIEDIPAETIGAELCKALDDEGYGARYAAGIRLLTKKTQDLHIIGGGYMRSVWNANLARLSAVLWAQLHHMPAVVSGVGLEPLNAADRVYAADIAKQITAFSCRDIPSRDAIDPVHTSATLAPDDCFVNALDGVYLPDDAPLPRTMVCMQTDLVDDSDALLRHMVNVLEAWHVPRGGAHRRRGMHSLRLPERDAGTWRTRVGAMAVSDAGSARTGVPGASRTTMAFHTVPSASARRRERLFGNLHRSAAGVLRRQAQCGAPYGLALDADLHRSARHPAARSRVRRSFGQVHVP